jgi:hypothetical protein
MYTHTYIYTLTDIYVCTHMHIHTHTYTHTLKQLKHHKNVLTMMTSNIAEAMDLE